MPGAGDTLIAGVGRIWARRIALFSQITLKGQAAGECSRYPPRGSINCSEQIRVHLLQYNRF
jgi:hypothetical protein